MPQGDKRGSDWEFYDASYDGYWNEELQRGLGQLTDGKIGSEDFKMGYYDYERSSERLPYFYDIFIFTSQYYMRLILSVVQIKVGLAGKMSRETGNLWKLDSNLIGFANSRPFIYLPTTSFQEVFR